MGPFWLSSPPKFHSRAPISCRSPPSSPIAPLSHQPSTISTSHRCLSDLDETHSQALHCRSPPFSPTLAFHHLHLAVVASQIWTKLIPEPPISCRSPPSSPALPLPHQPSTISTSFRRLLDLDITHSRAPHLLSFSLLSHTSLSPSLPRCRRLPDLDETHSRAPHLLSFSSLLLAPPLPHQPSTIFASRRRLPDLNGTHSRAPHLLPFSSLLSRTSLSPSSLAIVDTAGMGDWEREISIEPIALFSSLLSRTILSRYPLAVMDAAGMGDREWEQEISTEPIALFLLLPLLHQPFTILALPSWMPLGRGPKVKDQDEGKESMVAEESQGGVRLPETEPESKSGVGKQGTRT